MLLRSIPSRVLTKISLAAAQAVSFAAAAAAAIGILLACFSLSAATSFVFQNKLKPESAL